MEGISLVKFQIVSLQVAWQHFVQQRLDRNNKFAYRLLLKAIPTTTTISSSSSSSSSSSAAAAAAPLVKVVHAKPLVTDSVMIKDILSHVEVATRALITMDELIGDAAGVCEV
jgi:hypothetical protein